MLDLLIYAKMGMLRYTVQHISFSLSLSVEICLLHEYELVNVECSAKKNNNNNVAFDIAIKRVFISS